jgi:hypothetical protein
MLRYSPTGVRYTKPILKAKMNPCIKYCSEQSHKLNADLKQAIRKVEDNQNGLK